MIHFFKLVLFFHATLNSETCRCGEVDRPSGYGPPGGKMKWLTLVDLQVLSLRILVDRLELKKRRLTVLRHSETQLRTACVSYIFCRGFFPRDLQENRDNAWFWKLTLHLSSPTVIQSELFFQQTFCFLNILCGIWTSFSMLSLRYSSSTLHFCY